MNYISKVIACWIIGYLVYRYLVKLSVTPQTITNWLFLYKRFFWHVYVSLPITLCQCSSFIQISWFVHFLSNKFRYFCCFVCEYLPAGSFTSLGQSMTQQHLVLLHIYVSLKCTFPWRQQLSKVHRKFGRFFISTELTYTCIVFIPVIHLVFIIQLCKMICNYIFR